MRNELSCYFDSTFVVKQYDEGQKSSEWLVIDPVEGRTPPQCALPHGADEKVIPSPEWSGYFLGAKGMLASAPELSLPAARFLTHFTADNYFLSGTAPSTPADLDITASEVQSVLDRNLTFLKLRE
jgi:hypothetical protein